MKKIIFPSILVLILGLFSACNNESNFDLDRSVFIHDIDYPELPIYSEWGYNTFGMYVDRVPFVSAYRGLTTKIISTADTLCLELYGYQNSNLSDMTITLFGDTLLSYADMIKLDGREVDLAQESKVRVWMSQKGEAQQMLHIMNGTLTFKRVQRLYVDNKFDRAIVSGELHFQAEYPAASGNYITVNHGRFDLTFGYDNFYYLK